MQYVVLGLSLGLGAGLARLEMPRAWLRLVVALVVVLGGAAILGVLLWLAGLNLQQGSAS